MYLNLGLMKLFLKQMTNEKFEWSEVILYSMGVVISASDKYMLHKNITKDWNTVHYVHIHTEHASTGPGVSSVLLKLRECNFHRRCADFFVSCVIMSIEQLCCTRKVGVFSNGYLTSTAVQPHHRDHSSWISLTSLKKHWVLSSKKTLFIVMKMSLIILSRVLKWAWKAA